MKRKTSILVDERVTVVGNLTRSVRAPLPANPFAAFSNQYLSYRKAQLAPNSYLRVKGIIGANLLPFFGEETRLTAIRRADVQRYITRRSGMVSPASIARELNLLKNMLSRAVESKLIPDNPAHGIKAPRVIASRVRCLQPTEVRTILRACPEWLRPIVVLAVATGMRRGELLGLRWRDVDPGGERVVIHRSRNGGGRIVYLNNLAQQVLASIPRNQGPTDYVFAGESVTPVNVSQAFLRARRAANISDFRFQDLRHTSASWMISHGVDLHTVSQILGHKDLRMASRYQYNATASAPDAVKVLDLAFAESDEFLDTTNTARQG